SWQTSAPARAVRVGYSSADYGPLARMGRPAPPTARPHESPDIGARLSPLDDRPGAGRQRRRLALRSTLADRALARDRRRRDARVLDHALRAHSRAAIYGLPSRAKSKPETGTRAANGASPSARRAHLRAHAGSRTTRASSYPPGTSCSPSHRGGRS